MEVINDYSITKLKNVITYEFNIDYDEFCKILKDNNAILSGSSVLGAILKNHNWDTSDLDIYVNAKNYIPVRDFLFKNTVLIDKRRSSGYCNSFLSKNKIIDVCTFRYNINENVRVIDLMNVRNAQNVTNVIKNFDLTCCQSYFDGEKIYSFDLENILNYKAKLNEEYLQSFCSMNSFTCKRIKKYLKRGFKIDVGKELKINEVKKSENSEEFDAKKYLNKVIFYTVFNLYGFRWNLKNNTDFRTILCIYRNEDFKFSNYHHYNADGYDSDELNCLSDYIKIGKEKECIEAIKMVKNLIINIDELTNWDSNDEGGNFYYRFKYLFSKYNEEIKNELNLSYKYKGNYQKLSHITAFDIITFEEKTIPEFLENDENIIIKFADKFENYNKSELYDYMKGKIEKIKITKICRTYNNSAILFGDLYKLRLEDVYFYELINSGLKINETDVYTLIPYGIDKFIELYG